MNDDPSGGVPVESADRKAASGEEAMRKHAAAGLVLIAFAFLLSSARAQPGGKGMGIPDQGMQMMVMGAVVGAAIGYFVVAEEVTGVGVGALVGGAVGYWWHRAGERIEASAVPPHISYPGSTSAPFQLVDFTESKRPALRAAVASDISE